MGTTEILDRPDFVTLLESARSEIVSLALDLAMESVEQGCTVALVDAEGADFDQGELDSFAELKATQEEIKIAWLVYRERVRELCTPKIYI